MYVSYISRIVFQQTQRYVSLRLLVYGNFVQNSDQASSTLSIIFLTRLCSICIQKYFKFSI